MFFIRDRSIIISPACLPLHKEQNQSCAPNAPSPFHREKHLLSSASSQLCFPTTKELPTALDCHHSPSSSRPPSSGGCKAAFLCLQLALSHSWAVQGAAQVHQSMASGLLATKICHLCCTAKSPEHGTRTAIPQEFWPQIFGLPSCAAGE